MPFLSFINIVPNYFLNLYDIVVQFFAKINSIVSINNVGAVCLVLFVVFIFIAGNFCILKFKPKLLLSIVVFVLCICFAILNIMPKQYNLNSIISIRTKFDNCYILTTKSNNRVVILNELNNYAINSLSRYFNRHNITNINAIITIDNQLSINDENNLSNQLDCEIVEVNSSNFYEYETKNICNINISVTSTYAMQRYVVVSIDNKNILFCYKKLKLADEEEIVVNFNNLCAVLCKDKNYANFETLKIVYQSDGEQNVVSTKQQNFFTLKI